MFTSETLVCALVGGLIFDRAFGGSSIEIVSGFRFRKGRFGTIASEITACVHYIVIRRSMKNQIGSVAKRGGSITDLLLLFLWRLFPRGRVSTRCGLACVLIFTILSINILFFC